MKQEKFYITTAIDYVNDRPHLGHALEKIQADVLARYARLRLGPENVLFLTGTDEHGVKIQRAAEKAGRDPQTFVDETSAKFRLLKEKTDLSWDRFIRTTDADLHYPGVEKMWRALRDNGDLEKRTYRGLYCVGHEAFITEKDLVDGKCQDHQKEPEVVEEENWFFKLSKYTPEIKKRIASGELQIIPETRRNEIMSLLEQGLEDVSFSRPKESLGWGIPVPDDDSQAIYVWADALVNYISAIGYGREEAEFEKWWPAEVQVIGKDILRFHAAIWPAMLLSAGLPLPKKLCVHGFITVEGQKMSKTIGNVIDPVALVDEYGEEAVRFYLLHEISSEDDGDFSRERMEVAYNAYLANGIGNLTARILKMAEANNAWPDSLPGASTESIGQLMDSFELDKALRVVWAEITSLDQSIQADQPFKLVKTDLMAARNIIASEVQRLYGIAHILSPFLPATALKIKKAVEERAIPPILFPRRSPEK